MSSIKFFMGLVLFLIYGYDEERFEKLQKIFVKGQYFCTKKAVALPEHFEKSGNFLFRYRSYLPLLILISVIPVIFLTPDITFTKGYRLLMNTLSVILVIAGFGVRFFTIGTTPAGTSGRNTQKQVADQLNTTGIYSIVRHPLYLGNYLIWAGLAFFTYNLWYVFIVSLLFWLYYERIMFAEEVFLRRKFGASFDNWSEKVPAFFPSFRFYKCSSIPFSWKSIMRREYSGLLSVTLVYWMIDYLRLWHNGGIVFQWRASTVILVFVSFGTLILRTLKHHTSLLSEKDRS